MTPEEQQRKTELEKEINEEFSQLQQDLGNLKKNVQLETDETKKEEQNKKIKEMESKLSEINVGKERLERMTSLQEQELLQLKNRLESLKNAIQSFRGEVSDLRNEKTPTPTTCELLKNSETYNRLLNIISSNPKKFKDLKKDDEGNELDTPEKKLEYIFKKIRKNIKLFLKNKLGDSEKYDKVIDNTIAPAFEWNMMELLRDQGNETNVSMLKGMNKISFDSFNKLVKGVSKFATKASGSYNKFSQWINAIDYLSVHNGVLRHPNKSEVLSNPLKFKEYMNDAKFAVEGFSPYVSISDNIFKIYENQTFEFGVSLQEKQSVLSEIGNIQVVNNPKTTSLIVKMLDKPEKFLGATSGLQKTANSLLDGVNAINSVTKIFGLDIFGEIIKAPEERGFLFKVIDFVCKLIGITGGLEGIVKKWRMDRMNLTDEKNENISQIFKKYKELAGDNVSLSITDEKLCKTALNDFAVTDTEKPSTTKGDFLRDSIAKNMNISWVSPAVVQQILGDSYLKKETTEKGETKISINEPENFTEADKLKLAHGHLSTMKTHLENYDKLKDFYTNIHSTEDLALCITASLYVDKDDVIEGVKAKVFLPENYGSVRSDGTVVESGTHSGGENLDSVESSDKQKVSEQWVYDKAVEYGVTDKRQIAYILSTIKLECGFKNQKEIGGENKSYGKVDSETGQAYYGRGFIQLTHKYNYQKYTQIIKDMGKDFKDNDGNILKASDIDLVNKPDTILKSNELAIFIAIHGMKNGIFTGKKLDDFINGTKTDYIAARSIVNGSDRANEFANNAQSYISKINDVGSATA